MDEDRPALGIGGDLQEANGLFALGVPGGHGDMFIVQVFLADLVQVGHALELDRLGPRRGTFSRGLGGRREDEHKEDRCW